MRYLRFLLILILLPVTTQAVEPQPPAAIASAHPLATDAGHEILAKGGNAFDAAVAVAAALAVVEPWNSGLGGGGFILLHRARDGFETMIDARESAPKAAARDMYLDRSGRPVAALSVDGPLAAGIPGTPAALAHLAAKYGRLPLKKSLAPAIRLAQEGFPVTRAYSKITLRQHMRLTDHFPEAARVYLNQGLIYAPGDRLRQPELAQTLQRLADKGADGFYKGITAERLVQGVRAAGGIWTLEDLSGYRLIEREPVKGNYRGVRVTSASLPSSGGIVLMQMLKLLEGFELDKLTDIQRHHTIIEAMRLAYRDRARHLGDSDFVRVDTARLLSPSYIGELRREMRAPRKDDDSTAAQPAAGGANTTHFSIIDREGNRVAATLSLNTPFGSGFMPPGTGVLLNNTMDDFSVQADKPNTYGLVGGDANAIAPGKRPLSSMTPTFLENDDAVVVLGTPGGSRIITMVLLSALEFAHGRGDADAWVSLPRFHHQYLPDVVAYEARAFDDITAVALRRLGHEMEVLGGGYGNMQLVAWRKKTARMQAASDPRGEGRARIR